MAAETGYSDACGDRDQKDVVAKGPAQVLPDVAHSPAADFNRVRDAAQIAGHQHDVCRFNSHIGTCADGNADIRRSQGRGIVDAITNKGKCAVLVAQCSDRGNLAIGQNLGQSHGRCPVFRPAPALCARCRQ